MGMTLQLSSVRLPNLLVLEFDGTPLCSLNPQSPEGHALSDITRKSPHLSTFNTTVNQSPSVHNVPAVKAKERQCALSLRLLRVTVNCTWEHRTWYSNIGILPWLQTAGYSRSLRSLVLCIRNSPSDKQSLRRIRCFVGSLSNTLENLTLGLPRGSEWIESFVSEHLTPLPLSRLTHLHNLTISEEPLHPGILSILSAPIRSLEKLTMEMKFDNIRGVRNSKYKPLDERLCHSDFSSLAVIKIKYDGILHSETITDRLEVVFKQSHAKGCLITAQKDAHSQYYGL